MITALVEKHVMVSRDSILSVPSSERQQSILAASGGTMGALLHRGRERFELQSIRADPNSVGQCRTSHFVTYTSLLRSYTTFQMCNSGSPYSAVEG